MKRTVSILILNLSLSAFNLFAQSGWFQLNSGTTKELSSTYFADPNTGYAVGDSGLILKITNGGLNWSTQVSNTLNFLASVSFAAQSSGYIGYTVGAGGTILKTINAGVN